MKKKKRGFTIKINLSNRWLYIFIALGILAIVGVVVYAAVDKTKGWHSSTEIIVSFGTCKVTLQEAITNNYFKGVTPTSCLSTLPSVYHSTDKILITVNNYKMTLQEAVDNNVFRTGATRSYTTTLPIGGHFGNETEVSSGKSLQDSINAGELNSECTPGTTRTKDCDYLDTTCRDYHDVTQTCQSNGYWNNPPCDSYTNAAIGTDCGTNKICDGAGSCVSLQDLALGGTVTTEKGQYVVYISDPNNVNDGNDATFSRAVVNWPMGKTIKSGADHSWTVTLSSAKYLKTIEFITFFTGPSDTYIKTEFWLEYYDGSWKELYHHPLTARFREGITTRTYSAGYPSVSQIRIRVHHEGYSGTDSSNKEVRVYSMKMIGI